MQIDLSDVQTEVLEVTLPNGEKRTYDPWQVVMAIEPILPALEKGEVLPSGAINQIRKAFDLSEEQIGPQHAMKLVMGVVDMVREQLSSKDQEPALRS